VSAVVVVSLSPTTLEVEPGGQALITITLRNTGTVVERFGFEVLGPLAATGARVIGFGSHVDTDLLAAARLAGCEEVLARSAFFSRLDELLGSN